MIVIRWDGTTYVAPSNAPIHFLPDGTGIRVVFRFIQATEGLPTYDGLRASYATYNAVKAHYPSYSAIQLDVTLGTDSDYDITCFVSGIQINPAGRGNVFDDIEAGTCTITLTDRLGLFDPRWEDTILGPGRRVRTGTWMRVELWDAFGWIPMFTGLVDTWTRKIAPDQDDTVDIAATDFFEGLATAHVSGPVIAGLTGARIIDLLGVYWNSAWGGTSIAPGTTQLYAQTIEDELALDLARAAAAVDDGRIFVAGDGTFTYEDVTWRDGRDTKCLILGRGASDFQTSLAVCSYNRIAAQFSKYDVLPVAFVSYDDMKICAGTSNVPIVCGSLFNAEDSADDVVNQIRLEYHPVGGGDPVFYSSSDAESVERYGERGYTRDDLTPTVPGMLQTLADTLVYRWKSGEAAVTRVEIDLLREGYGTSTLMRLWTGDRIATVDRIPAFLGETDAWDIATSEITSMSWGIGPTQFQLTLNLDQLRSGTSPGTFTTEVTTDDTDTAERPARPVTA